MRFTCFLCFGILIALGICGAVYAFSGFNLLYFLCFGSQVAYRCVLGIGGACALFAIYAIIIFRPFKHLK